MHIYYKIRFSLLTFQNLRDIIEMKNYWIYCQKSFPYLDDYIFLFG